MAEVWPATLPQCFITDTVTWQLGDGRLRTPMEAGPAKSRRRSSAVSDHLSGQMKLSAAQWADLKTFVRTTVQDSDTFTFPDPDGGGASGTDLLVRFGESEPGAARLGRGFWMVSLDLEVLPQ